MKLMQRDIPATRFHPRFLALAWLTLLAAGVPVSHAAPVCNVTIDIPADGNIPASSSITNNSYQACFPSAVTEVNHYGT